MGVAAALVTMVVTVVVPGMGAAKQPEAPYSYGPPPEWSRYRTLGEAAVRTILIDPESARFEWPRRYRQGEWQPFLARKVFGYVSCGYVNARNRMGGYTGRAAFVVVIDHDQALYADIGQAGSNDLVSRGCSALARSLYFPAVSTMPTTAFEPPKEGVLTVRSGLGLEITPMAQGAYIKMVVPGSDAAGRGLNRA